jgi:hypothetical protein
VDEMDVSEDRGDRIARTHAPLAASDAMVMVVRRGAAELSSRRLYVARLSPRALVRGHEAVAVCAAPGCHAHEGGHGGSGSRSGCGCCCPRRGWVAHAEEDGAARGLAPRLLALVVATLVLPRGPPTADRKRGFVSEMLG